MLHSRRVLLIDDHPVVLQGIEGILRSASDLVVVGQATSAEEALETAAQERPDLIVLDLRVGEALAPDMCMQLLDAAPGAKVVILTAFDDESLLRACVAAGAVGVLLKDMHGLDLVGAFRRVLAGHMVVDERLRVQGAQRARVEDSAYEPLTPREHQILRLLTRGLTSKEVAEELGLTQNTVRSYTQSVLMKLHVTNRVQALTTAQRLRLI